MAGAVGFIGLGTMGGPMAANLAKAGVPLVVHDASPAAAAATGKLAGVTVAASPAEVASRVSVLFTCLPNDAIVRAVYLGDGGIGASGRAGLITCDCSTVSPEATLAVAAGLAQRGIVHMDTPMLGSQPQAVSGEIFFIVGGDQSKPSIANNGAAGMPNFRGTRFGTITRIGAVPVPAALAGVRLYGADVDGLHVDALAVRFDAAAWDADFRRLWPAGSDAEVSYGRRIADGPPFGIDDALGRSASPACSALAA